MTDQSIQIHYEATAEDYRRVLFWYQWNRLLMIAIVYILFVGLIVYVLGYGAGGPTREGGQPTMAFMFLLILPVLVAISGYFGIWRQAEKIAKISEPTTATFRDTGIKIETPSSTTERSWERFNKVYETKLEFIFFPYENVFYMIPKRCFRDEEIGAVKDILLAALGKKAILKR